MEANKFKQATEELLCKIMQIAGNMGGTDGHPALNYFALCPYYDR